MADISAHYALVAPLMERLFGDIPIVWTTFDGDSHPTRTFHEKYFGHYSHLSGEHVQRLAAIGAREFYSWFPTPQDPERARFARFLLEGDVHLDRALVKQAAQALREVVRAEAGETIPVLDGAGNIALFLPLQNAPDYAELRLRCHAIARAAIARHPQLFSEAPDTSSDGRVHIHVSSNAVGRFSIMPYSLRYSTGRIAMPIAWMELEGIDMRGVALAEFPARLREKGDLFGAQLAAAAPAKPLCMESQAYAHDTNGKRVWNNANGALLRAVVDILSDGIPRTAQQILDAGLAAKTIDPKTDVRALKIDLTQNIARTIGRGRKPRVAEDPGGLFRINEPPDPWPPVPLPPPAPVAPATQALIDRLNQTAHATKTDGSAFEIAVCDAFAALGFLATHMGGVGNPDGHIDAPLGVLGYRAMLECKSGIDIQKDQMVFEAAKFREAYNAQYCLLIGPDFGQRFDIVQELQTHGVSAWSVDTLIMALTIQATPRELEALCTPGFAEDGINDILWARNHGEAKRVRTIAEIIRSVGWTTQLAAAQANSPATAPLLTEDAAMLLVDQELAAKGCHVNCTREEVRAALAWLTSPIAAAAEWTPDKTGVVILRS